VEFARLETSIALEYRDAVRAGDREWIKRVFQRYVELHPKCSVAFDEEDQARRRDAVSSLTRSGKILEVGCADGGIISDLDPEGRFLVGLDIAMDYLTEGRPPAHYVNGMAEALPFVDDAFDTVLLPEIVEHVPDPREVIAEAVRVATRDVVLTFPVNVPDPTHLWNFSEESFDDLVGAFTELRIDEKKSVGRFRVWRAVLRRQT
jgi:ubiquinone/menaquinone biosynthesis C-methylase UbiE